MNQHYPQQPQQPQQPGWGGPQQQPGVSMPQPPKKRSAGKIVGLGCLGVFALFAVIGIIGSVVGDGDGKNGDHTSSAKGSAPTDTASPKSAAQKGDAPSKDVEGSDRAETGTSTLGGDIGSWVAKMTSHGVAWEKQGAKESIAGLPPTRDWFGEAKGAPSLVAHAITDTHRGILSLSCNAAGFPKGRSSEQVALFTDCVTAANLDGIDNAKVRTWIQTKLPAMLDKDGMQVENLAFGKVALSMDTAGNTAAISIEQQ
ncbi:hypothetical protein ACIHCX_28005 [Streptomyces sp. NPDC052043]|uniref:hypothetical protein n=1 Tax=Streptomyces sp. NPDC052043 TaxID=3365684 RepID=UPI0037D40AD8